MLSTFQSYRNTLYLAVYSRDLKLKWLIIITHYYYFLSCNTLELCRSYRELVLLLLSVNLSMYPPSRSTPLSHYSPLSLLACLCFLSLSICTLFMAYIKSSLMTHFAMIITFAGASYMQSHLSTRPPLLRTPF